MASFLLTLAGILAVIALVCYYLGWMEPIYSTIEDMMETFQKMSTEVSNVDEHEENIPKWKRDQ